MQPLLSRAIRLLSRFEFFCLFFLPLLSPLSIIYPREENAVSPMVKTVVLLTISNVFMTFAWYSHLKNLNGRAWYIAAAASWGIALFEYMVQVPANRIGYSVLTLPQLKIMQEVITLSVFVPFTLLYMKETLSLNYLWACLCLVGAVFFIFRG